MTPLNFPNQHLLLKKKIMTLSDLIQKVKNSIEIWHYEPEMISKNEWHHWIFRTNICSWNKKKSWPLVTLFKKWKIPLRSVIMNRKWYRKMNDTIEFSEPTFVLIQKVENSINIWHYEPEVISKNGWHHWIFRTNICCWKNDENHECTRRYT